MKPSHARKLIRLIHEWKLGTTRYEVPELGRAIVTVAWRTGFVGIYRARQDLETAIDQQRAESKR